MPNRDPLSNPPKPESPRGPQPEGGIPDRVQEKPPLTPVQNPGDSKNPQDPRLDRNVEDPAVDPALLPIGDPAGAA